MGGFLIKYEYSVSVLTIFRSQSPKLGGETAWNTQLEPVLIAEGMVSSMLNEYKSHFPTDTSESRKRT